MRRRRFARAVALALGLGATACGHHSAPEPGTAAPTPGSLSTTTSPSGAGSLAPETPTSAVTSPSVPSLTAATTARGQGPPETFVATGADRAQLIAAFSAHTHIAASAIGGIVPSYLYLAHVPTSDSDLAVAKFTPSTQAPPEALIGFQDGGNIGVFSRAAGGGWTMTAVGVVPFPCPGAVPAAVQALWHLADSPYC